MIYLVSFVLVFAFVNVNANANVMWTGAGADNLWDNAANWEGNNVPSPSDWVNIEAPGAVAPNGPLIQDGMDIQIDGMSNELPGEPTLTITGGNLTITGWGIWWGDAGDCVATCYMSGGTMTLTGGPGIHEFGWGGASGKWIMTGGTVNAKGTVLSTDPGNTGELYLHGGTYNIGTARATNNDRFGGGLVLNDGGLIDITEGTLILEALEGEEDRYMQYIEDLMAAGQITAYAGAGVFDMDFDIRNPGKITLTAIKEGKAYNPSPADGAIYSDVLASLSWSPADVAVSHDVYFGEDFDNVNNGTGDTFQGNQDGLFFVVGFPGYPLPDGLVPGTTYYWRIDEVNDADPNSPWKGDVWSFMVPPRTAYAPDPADGAEFVDPNVELSWAAGFDAISHIVYFGDDFDDVNSATEGTEQGAVTYTPGTLDSEKVYYWRVDEDDTVDIYKGDVWSFTTPGAVGNPAPANGAEDVKMTATLSWKPADSAASHEVYFGTDKDAVRNADKNSPEYKGPRTLGAESYDPGKLAWYTTYYWRVDEVDSLGSSLKGPLWSFTTADFISVDDFEDYDIGNNEIWCSWKDGLGYVAFDNEPGYNGNGTGSAVGDETTLSYMEEIIVHGGGKSMPVVYDNNQQDYAYYSEVELTLDYPRDWTEEGVGVLTIWFRGRSDNDAEPLYVAVSNSTGDSVIVVHDDPAAALLEVWTKWEIPLQTFADQGIILTDVDRIALGQGTRGNITTPGGTGKMYYDDIRLDRPAEVAQE
jgi:hypothetical protein